MIPKIDRELGLSVYSTEFQGSGGKIKLKNEDFKVKEIISEKSKKLINDNDGFSVYLLKKNGIDTTHALNDIKKRFGITLKSLGLKDSSAITEQYVYSMIKAKPVKKIEGKKYNLEFIGFTKKPLSKQDMIGNHFLIKIENPSKNISEFSEFGNILNFFGYQRFGSKRPITHIVGKMIVQKDFKGAVDVILNTNSEYDTPQNNEVRNIISQSRNYSEIIDKIPKSMDIELTVMHEMEEHNDPVRAIRAIPLQMRRFYVQAYQSFLFNRTVSEAFEYGENLFEAQNDDICFDKNAIIGKFQNDESQKLAIPLVGHSYYKKTRFDFHIQKILFDEAVSTKDFLIKELQEVSIEGGFRNASLSCTDYSLNDNIASFTLSRGSFATIVLREIMKPNEPLSAGF